MNTLMALYTTAALMAFVAVVCTALCCAWSIPSWRRQLARSVVAFQLQGPEFGRLSGWKSHVGSGMISIGIAACATIAWLGTYKVLAELMAASW